MKNNELLLTVSFQQDNTELVLLMDKDITLKAMLEALFYGLKQNDRTHFALFKAYARTHRDLMVLYRAINELSFIDVGANADKKLYELGIVTTSCVVIPSSGQVALQRLFPRSKPRSRPWPSTISFPPLRFNCRRRRA